MTITVRGHINAAEEKTEWTCFTNAGQERGVPSSNINSGPALYPVMLRKSTKAETGQISSLDFFYSFAGLDQQAHFRGITSESRATSDRLRSTPAS
jgi:hypothetical protein